MEPGKNGKNKALSVSTLAHIAHGERMNPIDFVYQLWVKITTWK